MGRKGKRKSSRLVLPCADDAGRFRCYLCGTYVPGLTTLYEHMCGHKPSAWRKVLPKKLKKCSEIVVRHKLFDTISFDDSDDDDEEWLMKYREGLRAKKLKGVADTKKDEVLLDEERGAALGLVDLWALKLKEDEVLAQEEVKSKADEATESGCKVVFDFDLNVAPTEEEEEVYIHALN